MPMAVVGMPKSCQAHNIYQEAQHANNEKLIESVQLMALPEPFKGIEYDLDTD